MITKADWAEQIVDEFIKDNDNRLESYTDEDIARMRNNALEAMFNYDTLDNDEGNIERVLSDCFELSDEEYTCDEFANGDKDLADYLRTVLGTGKHTTEDFESALEGYKDNDEDIDVSDIAKAITQNDLGRSL